MPRLGCGCGTSCRQTQLETPTRVARWALGVGVAADDAAPPPPPPPMTGSSAPPSAAPSKAHAPG
eukprot:2307287-Prorocentrum_lima.AAC.1